MPFTLILAANKSLQMVVAFDPPFFSFSKAEDSQQNEFVPVFIKVYEFPQTEMHGSEEQKRLQNSCIGGGEYQVQLGSTGSDDEKFGLMLDIRSQASNKSYQYGVDLGPLEDLKNALDSEEADVNLADNEGFLLTEVNQMS